jgi:hypothetical protein
LKQEEVLPVTNCTQEFFHFPPCRGSRIEVNFQGGKISSDGEVVLLREVDRRLHLTAAIARSLDDPRRQASCEHDLLSLIRQRIYALALGYEDLNDHQRLREDVLLQTALERDQVLASASTLCRFENRAEPKAAQRLHEVLVEQFISSFKRPPKKLILDFDATDDAVHRKQQGRFFHGYYDHYCFLPLYVFCGDRLLVSYLRPSKIDAARHAWAILALLVKRLRQAWPAVRIILRADAGFCRYRLLAWCYRHHVGHIVGIARNNRLNRLAAALIGCAERACLDTGATQRLFTDIAYGAKTWDRARRVIVKAEHSAQGANPRYVVTNLKGEAQALYERLYCARGEMENRIKEQQLDLFADRTSCSAWWANQFRLLFSSLAYSLLEVMRHLALRGTELARAQAGTIRLKLLKIGAVILRNTKRVRILLSSGYPHQALFLKVVARLAPD